MSKPSKPVGTRAKNPDPADTTAAPADLMSTAAAADDPDDDLDDEDGDLDDDEFDDDEFDDDDFDNEDDDFDGEDEQDKSDELAAEAQARADEEAAVLARARNWSPPLVAIVGRPNVGKSTLFNRLLGFRSAIVYDTPGVTRDRHYGECEFNGHAVRIVDTGGFAPGQDEGMLPLMREQAQMAIDEADAIIFLTDARVGPAAADEEIAEVLRRSSKPVLLAANKVDAPSLEVDAMAMYSLGFDEVYPISCEHNRGILDLNDAIIAALEPRGFFAQEPTPEQRRPDRPAVRGGHVDRIRVCFVGKPNVGKSTMVNQLLGNERVICADQPGTTRDAIDIEFTWNDEAFTLVDTAGLRRKRSVIDAVERYSVSQSVRAIERCHVAVLVLDASQTLSDQDNKIAALVLDRGRACVVAVNKWDAIEKDTNTVRAYERDLETQMPYLTHAPKVTVSAKTGQRVDKLFEQVRVAYENFNRRVPTSKFNAWLFDLQERVQPPTFRGKKLRMYYGAQLAVRPPHFVIQCNTLGAISPSYEKFLISQIRQEWDFLGSPVRLSLKKKQARRKTRVDAEQLHAEIGNDLGFDNDRWLQDDDALEAQAMMDRGYFGDDDDDEDDDDGSPSVVSTPLVRGDWLDDDDIVS